MKKNIYAILSHNPVIILIIIAILILIIYFMASPFQICSRSGKIPMLNCLDLTSW